MPVFPSGITEKSNFYPYAIDQSLRFNDDDSAYLSRTPATAGNRKTWTFSAWVKRGNFDTKRLFSPGGTGGESYIGFVGDRLYGVDFDGSTIYWNLVTTAVFRDPSAWYHIVIALDTTDSTPDNRLKYYVNGVKQTSFNFEDYPSLDYQGYYNDGSTHYIGRRGNDTIDTFDGYLAEINFIDGQALDPTSFGEFKSGVWVANEYTGTYGTNGFYLPFTNGLGDDESGNGNDWTPNNLAATDIVLDGPTNNFATWNAVDKSSNFALSQGNLRCDSGGGSDSVFGTFAQLSGRWYWEIRCISNLAAGQIGIATLDSLTSSNGRGSEEVTINGSSSTNLLNRGSSSTISATGTAANDIIGIGLDLDNDEISFYRNGTLIGSANSFTNNNETWKPVIADSGGANDFDSITNFGQDSSFAGNETAQGNTDENGIGDFYYTPPAGFLALSTANLPEPAISPADDASPSDYFNTVLYTGNGTSQTITGVGFDPDTVWCKSRSNAENHNIFDIVRGDHLRLKPNDTEAEFDTVDDFSFESDGFFVGNRTETNGSGQSYVAWNWKANGAGVTNTDGSITSTVSASPESGFSIVSYTGTGSNATVGHGLDSAPEMVIVKDRDASTSWIVYSNQGAGEISVFLNSTSAAATSTSHTFFWNDITPTSTTFGLGSNSNTNASGNDFIAYCFHSVEGYSAFGSYTGNGSSDGPFVYTGFRPAFVIVKRTNGEGQWDLWDSAREKNNVMDSVLQPNRSNSESTDPAFEIDFLGNGFKLRTLFSDLNGSGNSYIYMAFAETPFKFSNAR